VEEKYYYGIEALSKGDAETAGVFFEEILTLDPQNFRTLVKYGELLRESGNSQRAISMHQQALDLSQNNVKVLHELSLDYLKAGNPAKAKEMLEQIIEISPKGNVYIHKELRNLLVEEKNWPEALKVQRQIMGLVNGKAEKELQLNYLNGIEYENALLLKNQEKYQGAIERLEGIIDRDDKFLPAHLLLGECYLLQNNDKEAIATWRNAFDLTDSPVCLARLENYYLENDSPDKAIEMYNNVIFEYQDRLLPRFLLGKLFYRLEMLDRAMEIFNEIDSEFEHAPALFYFKGKIHARKGDHKEAAESFRRIIQSSGILEAEYVCTVTGDTFTHYVPYSPKARMWNTVKLNVEKGKSLSELHLAARPIYS
jgi:lipopolysaccharide biosynthesis regulator YciM